MNNTELLEKAKKANSPEDILAIAKENGVELTAEQAAAYFKQITVKSGELADEELANVAGGACHNDGWMVTTLLNHCKTGFICKRCDSSYGVDVPNGEGQVSPKCMKCGCPAYCSDCKECSYEKGLWLCKSPVNKKG